ncbi:MAG TPA: hypothetical protein VL328_09690 [Gemmatimonadaceae bacterium]|jgi:hypothetical protein|nr:hypothetical protein [Gemmatimonadaceae bacterium]
MDDTRARFLAAIATQVPPERVAEVHLFAPIRQGGLESGVAVVALERDAPDAPDVLDAANGAEGADVADGAPDVAEVRRMDAPQRYVVCTARYRHTLKGPDRGKWEVSVTEEADAPLVTVDAVVRGVQRRSGDVDEIVRLSGDELRAALPAPASPAA